MALSGAAICCNHVTCRREVDRAVDQAVHEVMIEFARFMDQKAANTGFDTSLFAQGLRNAAADAELFVDHIRPQLRRRGGGG